MSSGYQLLLLLRKMGGCVVASKVAKPTSILMFHGVVETADKGAVDAGLHLPVDQLEKLFAHLAQNYSVISLQDALAGKHGVVITFDDGYRSNYSLAYPLAKKFNIPFTVFVTTGFLEKELFLWHDRLAFAINTTGCDSLSWGGSTASAVQSRRPEIFAQLSNWLKAMPQEKIESSLTGIEEQCGAPLATAKEIPAHYQPLRWSEVEEMQDSGLCIIGAHTHTHKILSRCSADTLEFEVKTCRDLLEQKLGQSPDYFAYPNGTADDLNESTGNCLERHGFSAVLTTENGYLRGESDRNAIPRFGTPRDEKEMDVICSGLPKLLGRVR